MERRIDLHVHTYYSDGTFSPEEVVKEAAKRDLAAIAISDHDTTDGIDEARKISKKYNIEVVPAVEVTAEMRGIEIHLLGYLMDIKSPSMIKLLKDLKERRIKRIYSMIEKLKQHNLNISPEAVFKLADKGTVGRLHLATALYNEGLVPSVRAAFSKYISDDGPCYVTSFNVSPEEVIACILKSGGVPVYAHPGVVGRDNFIPEFMKVGLRGLEVYHTDHNKITSERYLMLAQKLGLLVTGGSDYHGLGKKKVFMGGITMPYSALEKLKKEARDIRAGLGV